MITDEKFKKYIGQIGDQYDNLKDAIRDKVGVFEADNIIGMLADLRDTACIALRESHTTKNFNDN